MMPDFLIENENEIIRNILKPDSFVPDSFEIIPYPMDMKLIVGQLKEESMVQGMVNPGKKSIQGVKFAKPTWSIESALEWLQSNQKYFKSVGSFKKQFAAKELKSIKGVEIFSAGTWNGDSYTNADLDKMVDAFEKTKDSVRPFLKLGHSDEQKLLQKEGLPAAGWVGRLYRKGEKLLADFVDIPEKIYELIENKAYRKVSSEIYVGIEILKDKFDYMLGAVALLGAETPGVMNLSDILSRYGLKADSIKTFAPDQKAVTIKSYSFNLEDKKEGNMPEENKELIELKLEFKQQEELLKKSQAEVAKYTKVDEETKTKIQELEDEKNEIAKQYSKTVAELRQVEIEKQADQLTSGGLITKGMRPFAVALLGEEKKEYAFGEGEKEEKLSKFELVKKLFELQGKADVNLENGSEDLEGDSKKVDDDKILEEVEKYALDNKVSFSAAYKEVAKKYEAKMQPKTMIEED